MASSSKSLERLVGEMNIEEMASSLKVGEFGHMSWREFDDRVVSSMEGILVALLISICSIEDPLKDNESVERRREAILAGATVILNRVGSVECLKNCKRLNAWLELIDFFHSLIPERVEPRNEIIFEDEISDEKEYLKKLISCSDELGGNIEFALISSLGYLFCFCSSENVIRKRGRVIAELEPSLATKVDMALEIYRKTRR